MYDKVHPFLRNSEEKNLKKIDHVIKKSNFLWSKISKFQIGNSFSFSRPFFSCGHFSLTLTKKCNHDKNCNRAQTKGKVYVGDSLGDIPSWCYDWKVDDLSRTLVISSERWWYALEVRNTIVTIMLKNQGQRIVFGSGIRKSQLTNYTKINLNFQLNVRALKLKVYGLSTRTIWSAIVHSLTLGLYSFCTLYGVTCSWKNR